MIRLAASNMGEDRSWMYNGWDKSGAHSDKWVTKTMTFLDRAFSLSKINKVRAHVANVRI